MKLTQQQAERIQEKTGLEPVPSEVAAESGLTGHFGDDTFYLNADGIYVFQQPGEPAAEPTEAASTVTAVKIASVEPSPEGDGVAVRSIEPQETTLTVELAQ